MSAISLPKKTINEWLLEAKKQLEANGIGTARLDALILLEDTTGKDRASLLAHPERILTAEQLSRLNGQLIERAKHIPLAYIRQKTEFYGREFLLNRDVLEPRPESETMIELLIKSAEGIINFVDVGTGSGAIAITAKLEIPDAQVYAVDIDEKCLKVAHRNAEVHRADITLLQGNLLEPLPTSVFQRPTALLCNLPYVPDTYHINEAAMMEPRIAIFGGQEGLDIYRKMFDQISLLEHKPRLIFTESLPFQHHSLASLARSFEYSQENREDFIQIFRHKA